MIARLSGTVAEKGADHAVVDVGGVGYLVHLSAVTLASLPPEGGRATLRTFTNVRQDAIELFGFATEDEEAVFRALIDVKGVGPRAAQNILSGIVARDLARAIAEGDVGRLTKVPGVGKKTAERLVVELKEKLALLARAAGPAKAAPGAGALEQLRTALVNLGYRAPQADSAVDALRDGAEGRALADLVRDALKLLRG
ncbi:MAG TPA: Holliday junction branch migration protein RuvA [Anaeromyxobacter sp.]|nr:Holliday junction branch migration protein RuvA [Anaeromyxobacter sp.]